MQDFSIVYESFNARCSATGKAGANVKGRRFLRPFSIGVHMIQFFDIDDKYATYLRSFDQQVPYITYAGNNKFVCGIVLSINGCDYFAPISSQTKKQQTNMLIYDKHGNTISSIKFSYMLPVPASAVTRKDFSLIKATDPSYADLLLEEYSYCKRHESTILEKAKKIYAIGCNPSHILNYTCCKFQLLEEKCKDYSKK